MKSPKLGTDISGAEVTHISRQGIWVLVADREYFLPYGEFPCFEDARIGEVFDVEMHCGFHLYWPRLDVDLDVASLGNPAAFPLFSAASSPSGR